VSSLNIANKQELFMKKLNDHMHGFTEQEEDPAKISFSSNGINQTNNERPSNVKEPNTIYKSANRTVNHMLNDKSGMTGNIGPKK
jgi:hypothetical protein